MSHKDLVHVERGIRNECLGKVKKVDATIAKVGLSWHLSTISLMRPRRSKQVHTLQEMMVGRLNLRDLLEPTDETACLTSDDNVNCLFFFCSCFLPFGLGDSGFDETACGCLVDFDSAWGVGVSF